MSVGILKRLLSIANLVAVLAIALTAYGFVSHRSAMKEDWQPPEFGVPLKARPGDAVRIDNTGMPLGAFPKPVETGPADEGPKEKVELEAEIDKLGEIKSAIVVWPPYTDMQPALIFEYKTEPIPGRGKVYAIRLGEALITRPHSDPELRKYGDRENVRFKFVGCKPDPKNADWTLFEFDIDCDGKDIQTARWKGEVKKTDLPPAKQVIRPPSNTKILRDPSAKPKPRTVEAKPVKTNGGAKPIREPEVRPVRVPKPVAEVSGPIFQSENGAFATTETGIAYLRDNYNKILKDAQTVPYTDKSGKTRGLKVRRLASKSVANQFGIQEGDVILRVNTAKVRSKTQAVAAVKRELNKKVRFIEVEVLRLGAKKILRYDSRDPATRRKAKDAFRNR